jgi:hypothetical protein
MNDGKKKKPQKHQNKRAYKIVFDQQAIDHQKKVSLAKYFIFYLVFAKDVSIKLIGNSIITSTKR